MTILKHLAPWLLKRLGRVHEENDDEALAAYRELVSMEHEGLGMLIRVAEVRSVHDGGTAAWVELPTSNRVVDAWFFGQEVEPERYMLVRARFGPGRQNKEVLYVGSKSRPAKVLRVLTRRESAAARRAARRLERRVLAA